MPQSREEVSRLNRAPRWLRRAAPALLVLALSLAATGTAARMVRNVERRELETEFSRLASERCNWIRKALADHLNDLASVRGLYHASDTVTQTEFDAFVEPLIARQPSIHAIGWIPRVDEEAREAWEVSTPEEGRCGSSILELDAHGTMVPAARRVEYFPIQYLIPREGNERALGFDLASNPTRLEALQRARDTGRPTATSRITLVQETEQQAGFLICMPIYARGTPAEEEVSSRDALEGFVIGAFRAGEALDAVLALFGPVGIELTLHQVNRQQLDELAVFRPIGTAAASTERLAPLEMPFSFADRDWLVTATATSDFGVSQVSALPWVIGGGLLCTALMTFYVVLLVGRATDIERVVDERTAELARRDAELKQSNELLTAMTRAQSQFIANASTATVFDSMLASILTVTGSEYGFIGEVRRDENGDPFLKTHAVTNIAWNDETRRFYEEKAPGGMEFRNLETLFGRVMTSGKPIVANDPATDSRSGGLPPGHPDLNAFLGMPLHLAHELVGMVGIANREEGYSYELVAFLQPLLATCATIIDGYRNLQRRERAESALQRINDALSGANRELAERHREIVQLTYAITHDLQTPLATLRGSVSSLIHRMPDLTEDQGKWLARIKSSSERMVVMLNDLMVYAKAGSANLTREAVDVAEQVATAVEEMRPAAREKGITVEATSRPCLATGDSRVIQRVLLNLIGNAIKYHDGGRARRVRVHAEPSDDLVRITIVDDGPGVDPLRLEEIFQPFKRAAVREKGTGLGLAIVRKSVQSMGGRVWVESDGHSGATAVVELPTASSALNDRGSDNHGKAIAA